MKFESQYEQDTRSYSIKGVVLERDILAVRHVEDIALRIRAEIAQRVADRIMDRLGPAIDEAFRHIKENNE